MVPSLLGGLSALLWPEQDDPLAFAHPQANRQLRLQQSVVAYQFKRAKRRSIGFKIGHDGLEVSAPSWVPLYEVESAIQQKADWILAKLQESRQTQQVRERWVWQDGASIRYLGAPLLLRVLPSAGKRPGAPALTGPVAHSPDPVSLLLPLPVGTTPDTVRDAVGRWLKAQALQHFAQRLAHFAPLLGVQWRHLALSNARARWGSAKSDGSIRLHWRLMHFAPEVIDYVVVHELSHLRVMNHSPRFWATVGTVLPNYPALRQQLKKEVLPEWS